MRTTAGESRQRFAGILARVVRAGGVSAAGLTRPRGAAACLPAAIASIVLGFVPGPSAASSTPDLHAQIEHASRNATVTLQMSDGISVSGVFNGFIGDWRDSVASTTRYETWRATRAAGVPGLDQPLSLVLAAGDTLRGTFRGAGPGFLALRTDNPRLLVPVNYDLIASAAGDTASIASGAELRGALLEAPHLVGVSLRQGANTVIVPREFIKAVGGSSSQGGSSNTGTIVLVVVLAAVAVALICVNAANDAANETTSSCSNIGSSSATNVDNRFGSGDLTHGPGRWPRGETRRP